MRILMDIYNYSWDSAWDVVTKVISYTNHTVMPEALECWNEDLFSFKLPRIHMIVKEINRRLCNDLWNIYPGDWDRISKMSIIAYSQVRMANLSVAASHTVNGVSKLHSEILKKTVFHDHYKAAPYKFTNVTNGIAHRRWLCYSNPELSNLIKECIGDGFVKNPEELEKLIKFADDKTVHDKMRDIKDANKINLSKFLFNKTGDTFDTSAVLDVQVKRMHEYKRQLLNVLKIIHYYAEIEENPEKDFTPRTFIFGGKAAPGYYMAKDIIKLIWNLGEDIKKNPRVRDKLSVIYIEDYNVSTAEVLMPASNISEQISLAGKEASGTGCMKFMMNGAVTIGTLDGANVEMRDAVGDENIYIFGLNSKEVDDLWERGYRSLEYYANSARIKKAVDRLNKGFNGVSFSNIASYLIGGYGISDPYMCLADFDSYYNKSEEIINAYNDKKKWGKMSLINVAKSGFFAADRSIEEYAKNIWHLERVK
jgi:starch phosphorylase